MSKEAEFKKVYDEFFDYIFNYLFKRVYIRQDVEDLVSETFESIWKNWDSIDHSKEIKPFIFKIAVNKLNDYLRRKYKIDFKTTELDDEIIIQTDIKVESDHESIINEIINMFEEDEQQFMRMKYQENLSYREIAENLNITVNNAKVKNNRLLKKAKQLWTNKINQI